MAPEPNSAAKNLFLIYWVQIWTFFSNATMRYLNMFRIVSKIGLTERKFKMASKNSRWPPQMVLVLAPTNRHFFENLFLIRFVRVCRRWPLRLLFRNWEILAISCKRIQKNIEKICDIPKPFLAAIFI